MEAILRIQRRIRSKIEIRKARVDLIIQMQDRLLDKIYQNMDGKRIMGAEKMTETIRKFLAVDLEIKETVAGAYIDRCMANRRIAFSQWRLFFRE